MRKLKVSYVITEVSGVSFYRVWQPANMLRKMGHKTVYLWYTHKQFTRPQWEWEMDDPKYAGKIRRDLDMACAWGDVVVWMALHTPSSLQFFQEMRLKHSGKPFLLELDDIVFDVPLYNAGSIAYYPGSPLSEIVLRQIQGSDGLIVSTPFLKERLSKYHPNIHVIENTIDSSLWRRASPRRRRVNIGWVGGATHEADLRLLEEVVPRILAKHKHARFFLAHGCPEFFKHKQDCAWRETNDPRYVKWEVCRRCGGMDGVKWNHVFKPIDKYPEWVSSLGFDIGVAPLLDNVFNRAKSNLRWLEYSAMGIPTVASPVENFKKSIVPGVTGLFADNTDEWVYQLSQLIEDKELRLRMGENALSEVKRSWNQRVQAEKYLKVIEELTNAKPDAVGFSQSDR